MRSKCLGAGAAFVLALMGMSSTAMASGTSCAGADLTPAAGNLVQVRAAITCLVNAERVARGVPALRTVRVLRDSAARHSVDMIRRSYFSHVTPTGVDVRARLSRAGVRSKSVGENIGWGMGYENTARAIVYSWMHSAPHRANILSRRFTQTGVGIALGWPGHAGAADGATFTQVFAGR